MSDKPNGQAAPADDQITPEEYQATLQRLDELVREFDALPYPEVREKAFEMLQAIDTIHRVGIGQLLAYIHQQGHIDLVLRGAHDPFINTVLQLYDFLPTDDRTQVETALEMIRPYIHSHGGAVEVLDVDEGIVHLRLTGHCYGCAGSTATLTRGIEKALRENYPAFRGIEVHDAAPAITHPAPVVVSLNEIGVAPPRQLRRPVFKDLTRTDEFLPGTMQTFDVDSVRALVANIGGEFFAVRNNCPYSAAPLDLGRFTPPIIICPWHNEAWDLRTGKRSDNSEGASLQILPLRVENGLIQIAVNTVADEPKPYENTRDFVGIAPE